MNENLKYQVDLVNGGNFFVTMPTEDIEEVWDYFDNCKYALGKKFKIDKNNIVNLDYIVAIHRVN